MRVQNSRVPAGHRLIPMNGKLVAVPIASVGVFQATQHNVGYGTGATARVVAEPVILAKDLIVGLATMIMGSQFGQSAALGWHDVGNIKEEWRAKRSLNGLDPASMRKMLIDTVQGEQKGNWAILVSSMPDNVVQRELARRMTPNRYIDEQLTYGGIVEDFSQPVETAEAQQVHQPQPQEQRAPQQQPHSGMGSRALMAGSFGY